MNVVVAAHGVEAFKTSSPERAYGGSGGMSMTEVVTGRKGCLRDIEAHRPADHEYPSSLARCIEVMQTPLRARLRSNGARLPAAAGGRLGKPRTPGALVRLVILFGRA